MRPPPKFYPLILAGVLSGLVTESACAHESRIAPALLKGGKVESPPQPRVRVSIGFTKEPALEDEWNSIDLILFSYKDSCKNLGANVPGDFVGNPIDPSLAGGGSPGDAANLTVSALYLAYDQPWLKPAKRL